MREGRQAFAGGGVGAATLGSEVARLERSARPAASPPHSCASLRGGGGGHHRPPSRDEWHAGLPHRRALLPPQRPPSSAPLHRLPPGGPTLWQARPPSRYRQPTAERLLL